MQNPEWIWQIRVLGLLVLVLLSLLLGSIFLARPVDPSHAMLTHEPAAQSVSDPSAAARNPGRQSAATHPGPGQTGSRAAARRLDDSVQRPFDPAESWAVENGEEDVDQDRALEITGAVLDDRGELVPGITLFAVMPGAQASQIRAQTDRLGMFRLGNLRPGDYELTIPASEDHHALTQQLRAGTSGAELHLQRRLQGRVQGTVRNQRGQALAGIVIRSLGEQGRVRSGALGDYAIEIEWRKAGSSPVLSFEHPDFQTLRQRIPAPAQAGSVITVDVILDAAPESIRVAGQVQDRRGQPVGGAPVWLSASQPRVFRRVHADALGRFQFASIAPGSGYRLGVDARSNHAAAVVGPLDFGPADGWVEIIVDQDEYGSLSGQMVGPGGQPIPGMGLWLRRHGRSPAPAHSLRSDGSGLFHASGVPAGDLWLESIALPYLAVHGLLLQAGEHRELLVPVDWGQQWLFGQVLSAASRPIAGARVSLHWNQVYGELTSVSRRETRTDSEGYFNFANLGAEVYGLQVQANGHSTWRQWASPGLGELQVVLASSDGRSQ